MDRPITQHLSAFPKTPSVMNIHFTEYEAGIKHMKESGVWVRRDSFQEGFSLHEWDSITGIGPTQAML